jgi:hypothetical protein
MMHKPLSRRTPQGQRLTHAVGTPRPRASWAALAILAAGLVAGPVRAQQPPTPDVVPAYADAIITGTDQLIQQAGCASCGGGGLPPPSAMPSGGGWCGGAPCACSDDTCASCMCRPGKKKTCDCLDGCSDSFLGRFGSGFINCICCPEYCYEGVWNYTANAAFFIDTVRPQTYSQLRWDSGRDVFQPERGEYFWAKPGVLGGKGPQNIERRVDYDQLSMYSEVASGNFSFFVEGTYLGIEPEFNPAHSNFGDMNVGTKTLLIDCELMQTSFQFRTYIPTGNSRNGLGTGHVSLEPSLLSSVKVMCDTYLQTQIAYWIPIGGDQDYQGATWHYGASLNRLWFHRGPFQLISTAEADGWTFTDGAIVNRDLAVAQGTGNAAALIQKGAESYFTSGGGLRLVICDKYDVGVGASFAISGDHLANPLYRTEFRVKY